MPPRDVNVAAEAEHAIVWLGEIDPALLAVRLLGGSMDEGLVVKKSIFDSRFVRS